jgi:phage/plasmid-associated DNA primase
METPLTNKTLELTLDILTLGQRDIAKTCSSRMDRLKYAREKWYFCRQETNLWAVIKKPHAYVIEVIQNDINKLIAECSLQITKANDDTRTQLQVDRKKLMKFYADVASNGSSHLYNYLQEYLCDDEFAEKIDNNLGYLAFKDGVFNLKTGIFCRGLLPQDYITYTIESNYPKNKSLLDKTQLKVWQEFKKVLNNSDEHLDYFFSLIGHSFTGESHLVKSAYFMIDGSGDSRGDNGKTFVFNLIHQVMGKYVAKCKSSLLEKGNGTVHKQIAGLKGKRLIFMEEFPERQLNPDLFKELSDGGKIENQIMFGTVEPINIIGMLFALSNHTPKLDADETACYNRYKQVSFCSHFDRTGDREEENPDELEYIANTKLGDEILENHSDEIVSLIIEYGMRFYKSGIPRIPLSFLEAQEETKNANDEFLEYFENNLSKTNSDTDRLALGQIVENSLISKDKIKSAMKRMGFVYNSELKGMGKDSKNNKYYKGGYTNVCWTVDEDNAVQQTCCNPNTAGM